jgi:peptide/nickel transport system substrate-binding protein
MLDIHATQDPPGMILHTLGMFYGKRKSPRWAPRPAASMDLRPDNAGAA